VKVDTRWIVQAAAYVGAIWAFVQMWEVSKVLLAGADAGAVRSLIAYAFLFLACFMVLAITSYLKQRRNGTLKNRIRFFERLLSILGLT